jgi:CubicO group peptidase (beta-lactamase class C family)
MVRRSLLATITTIALALPECLTAQSAARDLTPLVKRVFVRWDSTTGPGCAVGVDRAGQPRYSRAFGEADLEYDIPNKPTTIFEAGSISKQFTAAATVLLALDGKLNLEDDVRKYVPELPQYERPITIRHLLNHTSGLRDWGEIAGLAGWPRETRVHTHEHVLDILERQRALNYPPGDKWSYTNSGYNLLAIIVSRVSGQPFATFSRERLFKPLGLTSTQWRDDFRRVVKGRAQAYSRENGGQWELEMPFENVHGNGGLLTTVSDLLTWTAMLERPTPQWKPLVDSMHVRGRLTNGDTVEYALGLFISDYRGVHRVEHSGATAGYRAELLRFPGKGLAVAVLCNAANANPVLYASQLVDSLLPGLGPVAARPERPRPDSATWKPNASDLAAYAGTYYSPDVETTLEVSVTNGALTLFRRPAERFTLRPTSTDSFTGLEDRVWFTRDASGRVTALHTAGSRAYDVVFERR